MDLRRVLLFEKELFEVIVVEFHLLSSSCLVQTVVSHSDLGLARRLSDRLVRSSQKVVLQLHHALSLRIRIARLHQKLLLLLTLALEVASELG